MQVLTQTPTFVLLAGKSQSEDVNNLLPILKLECIGNTDDFFPCVALLEAAIESTRERKMGRKRAIREVSALLPRACWVYKGKDRFVRRQEEQYR